MSTPAQALALAELLEGRGLAKKAAALELLTGLGAKLSRASDLPSPSAPRDPIATMVPALDRLLCGGLPRGGFVELSGRRSCGRFSIGIAALASATSSGEAAALVDLGSHLDPQSAEAAGVELDAPALGAPGKVEGRRRERRDAARGRVPARRPRPRARARARPLRPDAAWVRLERAARSRHAALLLLAPYRVSGVAAGTVLAADAARASWKGMGRAPRLLCGVSSRLVLQKDARARTGVGEDVGVADVCFPPSPLTLSPLRVERGPCCAGGRRTLSEASPSPPSGGRGQGEGGERERPPLFHSA